MQCFHVVDNLFVTFIHTTNIDAGNTDSQENDSGFTYFDLQGITPYSNYCDDFGPMSLASVYQFFKLVNSVIEDNSRRCALKSHPDVVESTNEIFLLGTYLIIQHDWPVLEVATMFLGLAHRIAPYCDVSPGGSNFDLHLTDCWGAIRKAKDLGWVDFSHEGFDLNEYSHFESPLNGDVHEVVPGKFLAMRGPVDIVDGRQWQDVYCADGTFSHRLFSPSHYIDILGQYDVRLVVRLNSPCYFEGIFKSAGFAVADLPFPDCTSPDVAVAAKFMAIAEATPGALAVHCKAGLGRTGTLIALYMMKHFDFTAGEAMGWLRIVRPGSVIGDQQHFLCARQAAMQRAGQRWRSAPPIPPPDRTGADLQAHIDQITRDVDQRVRAAWQTVTGTSTPQQSLPPAPLGPASQCWSESRTVELAPQEPKTSETGEPTTSADHVVAATNAAELGEHVSSAAVRRAHRISVSVSLNTGP